MTSNRKTTLLKRIVLAILCGCMVSVTTMADDQNSQSKSSSSDQSTSSSSSSSSDRSRVSGTSSDNSTSVSSPSYGQSSSSRWNNMNNMNMTAQSFIRQAAIGSMKEIHLGQLAEQKAQNQEVKQFAQRLVQDHTQANQQLMQIAQTKGISLPSTNMFASLGTIGSNSSLGQSSSTDQTSQGAGARNLDRLSTGQSSSSVGGTSTPSTSGTDQGNSSSTSGQSSIGGTSSSTTTDNTSSQSSSNPSDQTSVGGTSSSGTTGSTSSQSTPSSTSTSSQSSSNPSDQSSTGGTSSSGLSSSTSGQSSIGSSSSSSGQLGSSSTLGSSAWQSSDNSGQLSAQDHQMFQHLQSLSGSQFDQAFIRHMVQDHVKDIQKYEQASRQLQDTEIKNYVAQTLPTLRQHYAQAQQIARDLGVTIQDTSSPASGWQRDRLNDREGQPRSGSDASNLNR